MVLFIEDWATKMKILVNDNTKIKELKEEFNNLFPYLRIDFFTRPHNIGEGSPRKNMIPETKTFGQCNALHNGGGIDIHPTMSVGELEAFFVEHYGLSAQVFRRSGKIWLETTLTDKWTLEQQNKHGEAITNHVID